MKLFEELNSKNFEIYAAKHYINSRCLHIDEFYEDVTRFKYVVRLLNKYNETGVLQERLILNHIIIIYNVFEIKAANRMLFHRVSSDSWPALKAFLLYLNYIPHNEYNNVTVDFAVAKKLQNI